MIISYQLKVFRGRSEVTFDEFEKLIFSIELEFYQKRSQPKNVSESILHGRSIKGLLLNHILRFKMRMIKTCSIKLTKGLTNCPRNRCPIEIWIPLYMVAIVLVKYSGKIEDGALNLISYRL